MNYQLTIDPIGVTIQVTQGQTLLDAALRQGIPIPHACGHGLCGTCKVHVREGSVDHGQVSPFALMDCEQDEGMALACSATLQSDATIEADIDEDPDAKFIPVRDFDGTVSRIVDLTTTIKALFIALDSPIQFQAGQYVQLEIHGLGQSRAFSIASSPAWAERTGEIELNVRLVAGGAGTAYLHRALRVGDRVRLSGPYGRFFVRQSARRPMVFMAGGSGLSGPRAMILDLLSRGCALPITLIYGQRSREQLYYDGELRELAQKHANFDYVPTLSDEDAGSDWIGARGRVHETAKAHCGPNFVGIQAYLCGPPPMVEACIGVLMQGRLFERDIYTERFLSAADIRGARSPLFKRV